MDSRPGYSSAQVLTLMLLTLVVTAVGTHWVDRNTEIPRDEVSGKELAAVTTWLHEFYGSADGLQRIGGLCEGGRFDSGALSSWVFDAYIQTRKHRAPQDARAEIMAGIQNSDEWKRKHSGK